MSTAVVCAYSPVGRAALEGLLEAGIEVLALYTYPQGAEEQWFEAPAALAARHGIPVFMEPAFNTDEVHARIRAHAPDFLFSFYFREMIQARFLDLPRLGAYNLHGSLLPKYRGRAPINWVLVKGETETGITLHAMTPKPDDGAVIGQTALPIAWDDSALSLTMRSADAGRALVRDLAPRLAEGTAPRIDQKTLGPSSYFGGRKPEDSRLDFAMSAQEAFNQIRAVADPWPNAFLRTEQGELRLAWALPSAATCPAAHFRETREGVLLGFTDGALRLATLRKDGLRGERPSEHAAWLRDLGVPEAR
ncbi:MAG TPA: formyltransferase family protein [Holophagaceae bacterium]|nr:formyltransferase family protein [Holophagaceae bacterium]